MEQTDSHKLWLNILDLNVIKFLKVKFIPTLTFYE